MEKFMNERSPASGAASAVWVDLLPRVSCPHSRGKQSFGTVHSILLSSPHRPETAYMYESSVGAGRASTTDRGVRARSTDGARSHDALCGERASKRAHAASANKPAASLLNLADAPVQLPRRVEHRDGPKECDVTRDEEVERHAARSERVARRLLLGLEKHLLCLDGVARPLSTRESKRERHERCLNHRRFAPGSHAKGVSQACTAGVQAGSVRRLGVQP